MTAVNRSSIPAPRASGSQLTDSQRAAVEHFLGPLLILAGPGSGKTRVMTQRIARLIERGVHPRDILAITFTNKAAREMAERVERLLPGLRIWVSTFHRFCARLLREHGRSLGLQQNFTIYDTSDQQQLIKQVLHDEDIDATHFPAAKIGHRISQAKNDLVTAELYRERYRESIGTHMDAVVGRVYPRYQEKLLAANAVDFDDLLLHVAVLLNEQPELREELDRRHRFILVDEYQDTNQPQYQIIRALSQNEPNLCVCGDPDQSIYGWRGARIENIFRFEHDYPDVKIIRLEDNFRSTPEILQVADALIAHNVHRKVKVLRTGNDSGDAVELRLYNDGQSEADAIAAEMRELVASGTNAWSDFAVLYRVNALSRSLETAFTRNKVPYQIAGGVAFFDRAEIKDLLGYLRLVENSLDRIAWRRVINTPARGIGKNTQEKLLRYADSHGLSPFEVARNPQQIPGLPKRAIPALQMFAGLFDEFQRLATGPVAELLNRIVDRTHYTAAWTTDSSEDGMQRLANVRELIAAAGQYDDSPDGEPSLGGVFGNGEPGERCR